MSDNLKQQLIGRHPSLQLVAGWLVPNPNLPDGRPQRVAAICAELAAEILALIGNDGPEMTAGVRKLLEAKDCFVRAALSADDA